MYESFRKHIHSFVEFKLADDCDWYCATNTPHRPSTAGNSQWKTSLFLHFIRNSATRNRPHLLFSPPLFFHAPSSWPFYDPAAAAIIVRFRVSRLHFIIPTIKQRKRETSFHDGGGGRGQTLVSMSCQCCCCYTLGQFFCYFEQNGMGMCKVQ